MKMKLKISLIFFLNTMYGENDLHSYSNVNLEFKMASKLKLKLRQTLRLKSNFSEFNQTFSELSLTYQLNDVFKISVPYRYVIYKDKTKHRLSISSSLKLDKNPLSYKYRFKLQNTKQTDKDIEHVLRNKFSLSYKINKKYRPFISFEYLNPYESEMLKAEEYRLSLGSQINLKNKKSFKIYYLLKREDLQKNEPYSVNVIGFDYNFSF
jgi:hypothetical protein